jgi:hypothetical protein
MSRTNFSIPAEDKQFLTSAGRIQDAGWRAESRDRPIAGRSDHRSLNTLCNRSVSVQAGDKLITAGDARAMQVFEPAPEQEVHP